MTFEADSSTALTLFQRAVARLRASSEAPLTFGGIRAGDQVPITVAAGNRSTGLHTLVIRAGRGLGGRAWARQIPQFVADYGSSPTITHDYDEQILAEGVSALAVTPVILDGALVGLIYVGSRDGRPLPERFLAALFREGVWISTELAAQTRGRSVSDGDSDGTATELARLRRFYADVRQLVSSSSSSPLRLQVQELIDRTFTPRSSVSLTSRQLDVLALVAVGYRNAAIADRLGLSPATVKSYLRSAMHRLDAHSRHEAATRAQEMGLIG
ncbi:LuxR C-terminal-related transcriptional regulator [Nocardia sp. NPDC059239]|uniref:LuxR C-terminal-related transcriptional regulator n=1 Tax=Nocardia sp. NPDC059239 TaxID=3346785 RepID=UPI0036BD70F1